MPSSIHTLIFPGAMNKRGFWLYVWRIQSPKGELLYVGRTGDSSSPNASSPITRMSQHLDAKGKGNMLFRHLKSRGIKPELCTELKMVAHGPVFDEQKEWGAHVQPRDKIVALEKKLADTLQAAQYDVLNTAKCKKPLDEALWREVCKTFAPDFPGIA